MRKGSLKVAILCISHLGIRLHELDCNSCCQPGREENVSCGYVCHLLRSRAKAPLVVNVHLEQFSELGGIQAVVQEVLKKQLYNCTI